MKNHLIKRVISLVVAKFHPHIFMHTFFAMSCICALWLWADLGLFFFLSLFWSKSSSFKVFGSNLEMLLDSQPPPEFWNTCSYFFLAQKQSKRNKMSGYLPKRDIKVIFYLYHDLFILICCYQQSYLIFLSERQMISGDRKPKIRSVAM